MIRLILALPLLALATACAGPERIAAPAPLPVPATAPAPTAAPRAPDGAAANLTIPARLPDGSYATPNRSVSAAAGWARLTSTSTACGCIRSYSAAGSPTTRSTA